MNKYDQDRLNASRHQKFVAKNRERLATYLSNVIAASNARPKAVKLHLAGTDEFNRACYLLRRGDKGRARYMLQSSRQFRLLSQGAGKVLP